MNPEELPCTIAFNEIQARDRVRQTRKGVTREGVAHARTVTVSSTSLMQWITAQGDPVVFNTTDTIYLLERNPLPEEPRGLGAVASVTWNGSQATLVVRNHAGEWVDQYEDPWVWSEFVTAEVLSKGYISE